MVGFRYEGRGAFSILHCTVQCIDSKWVSRLNNAAEKVKSKLAQWDMESPFWKKRQLNMWSDYFAPVTPVLSGRVSALRLEGRKFYFDGRVIKKILKLGPYATRLDTQH